jgi:phage baseplate assembly protein W
MTEFRQRDVETPHFALPFRLGGINGGAIVNEQDSDSDITDCIKTIIAFPIGSREELPQFGIPDLLFREITTDTVSDVRDAVARWETRVDLEGEDLPTFDEMVKSILLKARGSDPT